MNLRGWGGGGGGRKQRVKVVHQMAPWPADQKSHMLTTGSRLLLHYITQYHSSCVPLCIELHIDINQ